MLSLSFSQKQEDISEMASKAIAGYEFFQLLDCPCGVPIVTKLCTAPRMRRIKLQYPRLRCSRYSLIMRREKRTLEDEVNYSTDISQCD